MTLNVPVEMRDVSFGGFQLASATPVADHDVHVVRAVTAGGRVCTLRARVVRCAPPTEADPFYISGWEVEPDHDSIDAIAAIVDSLTAKLTFHVD